MPRLALYQFWGLSGFFGEICGLKCDFLPKKYCIFSFLVLFPNLMKMDGHKNCTDVINDIWGNRVQK